MKIVPIKVTPREETGKSAAKKLRAKGMLPAVVYGESLEPQPITLDSKELKSAIHTDAGQNVILNLQLEGAKKGKDATAIIREIQRDPIKGNLLHADFLKIALDEKIQATVPVVIVGEAPGAKEGGILQHGLWEIQVECLPTDIPEHLEIDVSNLGIGEAIRVGDLRTSEKVHILTHAEETAVSVVPPRVEVAPPPVAEVVEPEVIGEAKEEKAEEKAGGKEEG